MKKYAISAVVRILLMLTVHFIVGESRGQDNLHVIDSLKKALFSTTSNGDRIDRLSDLSYAYLWTSADSSRYYAQEAIREAGGIGDKKREVFGLVRLSSALGQVSNDTGAIEVLIGALRKAEGLEDQKLIALCYANLGAIYGDMGKTQEGMPYLYKALGIHEKLGDVERMAHDLVNLGMGHIEIGQLDSALAFTNQAYSIALRRDWTYDFIGSTLRTLGRIHQKMGHEDIALAYFRQSLPSAFLFRDWSDVHETSIYMGELFRDKGAVDSSIRYFNQAYQYARYSGLLIAQNRACAALAGVYRNFDKDSALKYMDLQLALKDKLNDEEKTRTLENLTYGIRQHEAELSAQAEASAEVRKRNIRYLGITVFIITLFLLLMLLAGLKAHPKLVRFSGVLSLLLLFEFITLLIHPLVAHWTHEDPVWMLLILVALAAIIVPLHHRIETWMVGRLTGKQSRVAGRHPGTVPEDLPK